MDEAALAAGVKAGDERAFETLIRTQGGRLLATARRILGNDDEAREAVHEGVYFRLPGARAVPSPFQASRPGSIGIVVNAALQKLRVRKRRAEDAIEDLLPRFLRTAITERFVAWTESA